MIKNPLPPPFLSLGEWQKYHEARQSALTENPGLRDQYEELLKEMEALQVKSDEAMVAADPKLKPVITKLDALRMRNGGAVAAAAPGAKALPQSSGMAPTISAAEWQELRAARSKAMQSNPDLVAESKKLQDKMRAYKELWTLTWSNPIRKLHLSLSNLSRVDPRWRAMMRTTGKMKQPTGAYQPSHAREGDKLYGAKTALIAACLARFGRFNRWSLRHHKFVPTNRDLQQSAF